MLFGSEDNIYCKNVFVLTALYVLAKLNEGNSVNCFFVSHD